MKRTLRAAILAWALVSILQGEAILAATPTTPAGPNAPQPGLAPSAFAPAEAAFRDFIGIDGTGLIFHLSYGTNEAPLPAEFMRRFQGQGQAVRTGLEGLTVVRDKLLLDNATHKQALGLSLRQIRVAGKRAEAHLLFTSSFGRVSWRVDLGKEHGKWKVRGKRREWELCG